MPEAISLKEGKGLFWFTVSKGSVHGWLVLLLWDCCSEQVWEGVLGEWGVEGVGGYGAVAHIMMARKERERQRGREMEKVGGRWRGTQREIEKETERETGEDGVPFMSMSP